VFESGYHTTGEKAKDFHATFNASAEEILANADAEAAAAVEAEKAKTRRAIDAQQTFLQQERAGDAPPAPPAPATATAPAQPEVKIEGFRPPTK
jgi:hypothetical protein